MIDDTSTPQPRARAESNITPSMSPNCRADPARLVQEARVFLKNKNYDKYISKKK